MSSVIQFLESMGKGPQLSPLAYKAAANDLDASAKEKQALIAGDFVSLGEMLGGRRNMHCGLATPERT